MGSYVKGQVFIKQLEYVIGKKAFDQGVLDYYNTWKFKHPNPNDFIRIMEKTSGLELDWYKEYMVNTTHYVDYSIDTITKGKKTNILLSKIGVMPMPIDVEVITYDGEKYMYNIPLRIMRGEKPNDDLSIKNYVTATDWPWTNPTYTLTIPISIKKIASITIDPKHGMADVDRDNDVWPRNIVEE